ncbi:MAG TPA: hypothetical protein VMU05_01400 [Dongiaceae bacterium]|nr:hypothetical protein [Dongiaceae bacterium]
MREAARFWESRRAWYNGALLLVVLVWLAWTWPHFRPALTLDSLGKMLVLALLANLCYSAAYVVEFFLRAVSSGTAHRRLRWAVFVLGLLLALLIENYWIADEIYPDVHENQAAVMLGTGEVFRGGSAATNSNFPAPLAVVGFLAASVGAFVAIAAVLILWFARKPRLARVTAFILGCGAVVYFALLFGYSAASHDTLLAPGQEKYFCEIDCHLAYSVVDLKSEPAGNFDEYVVTLRTRFDETTTSPSRPKDAPLTPSPREVRLIDEAGHVYPVISSTGPSLMTPLTPASSYTTQLKFQVPKDARGLRLLIETTPAWPDHFVIGDENSIGHKKTYFAL